MFDIMGRLYQIEAKVMPPGGNEFELTRFQQSLVFERGISNRSQEQVRAIREGCRGLAGVLNAAGNPVNPAGVDDPRCQARTPSEGLIPRPAQSLLEPQSPPDCAFKGPLSNPPTVEETRMKLDYEQQCYRQSEMIVRTRLQQLQNSVEEASKLTSRRNLQGRTP